jgi:ribosomal protein S18 acetylase RimI-like enzyme
VPPRATTLLLRPAVAADLPACAAIWRTCEREIHPEATVRGIPVDFARATTGEEITVAVAPSGEVVGFLSLWRRDRFVHFLYLRADWRGRGVGRALLEAARAAVGGPLELKCAPGNRAALAFYRRLGWREVERVLIGSSPHIRLRSPP